MKNLSNNIETNGENNSIDRTIEEILKLSDFKGTLNNKYNNLIDTIKGKLKSILNNENNALDEYRSNYDLNIIRNTNVKLLGERGLNKLVDICKTNGITSLNLTINHITYMLKKESTMDFIKYVGNNGITSLNFSYNSSWKVLG